MITVIGLYLFAVQLSTVRSCNLGLSDAGAAVGHDPT